MIKVLIADDEVKVIQLIEHLVDWQAFEMEIVGRVNDGEKALEAIFQQQPDLVVTDILSATISGSSFTSSTDSNWCRNHRKPGRIPSLL